jgi:hypothetical protein
VAISPNFCFQIKTIRSARDFSWNDIRQFVATMISCANIETHSIASARSAGEPPWNSYLPLGVLTSAPDPNTAKVSSGSDVAILFIAQACTGGSDKYGGSTR